MENLSDIFYHILLVNYDAEIGAETCLYNVKKYVKEIIEDAVMETVGKDGAETICRIRQKIDEMK